MASEAEYDVYVEADTRSDWGRRTLRGVMRFAAARRSPWRLAWGDPPRPLLPRVARGFITGVISPADARRFRRGGLPAVNYSSRLANPGLPSVLPDNAAIGRLAAAFFRERLYGCFAFIGSSGHHYSAAREAAFREALAKFPVSRCEAVGPKGPAELMGFLRRLPKGTAVFAANDFFARQVVRYAREAGRPIPDEIAVLGVDAEELLSMSAGVSISSIDPDFERIGFEAARLLDRLMQGGTPPARPMLVPPAGVVECASTGAWGNDDDVVARALALVRARACEGLTPAEVAREVAVGRRTLERRLRAAGAAGIATEIRRERVRRACELLRATHLGMAEIADRCGFHDVFYFSAAFKKATGKSPKAYRAEHRTA